MTRIGLDSTSIPRILSAATLGALLLFCIL